jgi:cation diffusion facilitator CzcD-associated flavoprotein CzcO
MSGVQPSSTTGDVAVARCDVCIVGAGIAGLNALFAASQYLSRDQKVILVDRRKRVGGMWVDTYPYVRLHQPHGVFTAGNIKWTLGQDRSYLATKGEVLDHFEHCLNEIKRRVRVDEFFGWTLESHDETDGIVRITCKSSDGQSLVIGATRLIKAYGFRIVPNDPLEISSGRVQSVSPDFCDMRGDEMGASDTPVWVIGGGKTAMDTAHALITEYPGREVNLVAGSGTFFTSRDRFFPTGVRRWWGGNLVSSLGMELARRFDGTNETAVWNWHRATYGTWLTPRHPQLPAGRPIRIRERDNRCRAQRRDHGPPGGCRRPQRRDRPGVP